MAEAAAAFYEYFVTLSTAKSGSTSAAGEPQKQQPQKEKAPRPEKPRPAANAPVKADGELTKEELAKAKRSAKRAEKRKEKEGRKQQKKGGGAAAAADGDEDTEDGVGTLKTPKGTQDYGPFQMKVLEELFGILTSKFKLHGAVTIETPVFELKETLMNKYGEDSKLIYDLQDQGGELCSLRYDLTVPFSRYMAMNRLHNLKRYHIGRVYRRDNPKMTKGRFREFYQCDFDIAGEYDAMIPDSECLQLMSEILDAVGVGSYIIKLNHRRLLDAIFAVAGVPPEKFRAICSAVDKLDKTPWEEVRKEMTETKGLDGAAADIISRYVLRGAAVPRDQLNQLRADAELAKNADAVAALADLEKLFDYCEIYGCLGNIRFDLSLARGLDYYTGVIYEAVLTSSTDAAEVGSVAAGGRYDNLIGSIAESAGRGGLTIPAVGFSVGVGRLFSVIEKRLEAEKGKRKQATPAEVVVVSHPGGLLRERMGVASQLRSSGIRATFFYKDNVQTRTQLNHVSQEAVPWAVIVRQDEIDKVGGDLSAMTVLIKDMRTEEERKAAPRQEADQVPVARSNLVAELRKRLAL